jgi:hypothetical protein
MRIFTGLLVISLLIGIGMAVYLLSQSSTTVFPFLALIVIFVLVLMRPLRQYYLPDMTFTPSASLLKLLGGGGVVVFVLIIGMIILLAFAQSKPP